MSKSDDLETMSDYDLQHYAREQRKYAYDNFERYKHQDQNLTFQSYMMHIYVPVLAEKFHAQYMKRHLSAREYLATSYPEKEI